MNKVRIITDSASDILSNANDNITVLPLAVRFGEEEFLDGVTITNKEYYTRLTTGDILPKTSQVTPVAFEEAIKKVVDEGDKAVVITISSKLSGTYQSACIAAAEFSDEDVVVIDSLLATVSEQVLVLYAQQLVDEGKSFKEVTTTIEEIKGKVRLVGLLDTLEYLKKGGRISAAAAIFGSALSIKPIIQLVDGAVEVADKARGKKNGIEATLKYTRQYAIDESMPVAIGYAGVEPDLLGQVVEASAAGENTNLKDWPVVSIGATIGTYTGPNSVVIGYFEK